MRKLRSSKKVRPLLRMEIRFGFVLLTFMHNLMGKVIELISIRQLPKIVTQLLIAVFIGILLAGCQQHQGIRTPTARLTPTSASTTPPTPVRTQVGEAAAQPTKEKVIATPTLAPTATPSALDLTVDDIVENVGITNLVILGLSGENLVNFLISALIVLLGSLAGRLLIKGMIWITKFTPTKYDGQILQRIERQLSWLISLFLLDFATARLAYLSSSFKQWADLVYFALLAIVIGSIAWQLIDFVLKAPLQRASSPENRGVLIIFAPLLRRTIQIVIIIVVLAIILQNFGVNVGALLAILGLGGLAVSLAAKETLEDMINGFIILIDRPFEIGDRIKIESMDTWGDVENIGSRTTRIRTLDNRLVIVPNSILGRNQVENYTYPDPSLRIEVQLGVAYGSDVDQVLDIIRGAVLDVPDVMQTNPPMVDFIEFGDSAMIFRAIYWLKTYRDIQIRTEVNKTIYESLTEAGIEMPYITYDVNLAYKNEPHKREALKD
jgi:MscS family membrane protein